MKKFLKALIAMMIAIAALAIVASAEPVITYEVVETETSGLYQIVASVSNDTGDFRVFANKISFDYSTILPSNYKGKATNIVGSPNSKAPLTVYTYTTTVYDPDLDEDVETTVTADYTQNPVWTVNGDRATLVFETYKAPASLPTNGMAVFKMYFVLAEGKSLDSFVPSTFTVETIDWTSGTNKYFYGQDSDGYTTNMSVTNNVVPAPTVITISVKAGDKVYLQDGTSSVIEEDNTAYVVPSTAGYVAVNTGYDAQKTYYINGTSAELVHTDAVLGSELYSLRDRTPVYDAVKGEEIDKNGLRFQMLSSQSSRKVADPHDVVEAGFLMTAKVQKVVDAYGESPELTHDKVGSGLVKKGVAYDPANGIDIRMDSNDEIIDIRGVFYNIPINQKNVTTTIISRPYYKVDNTYVYGEASETTLYDVAAKIKDGGYVGCSAELRAYIDEIIECVEGEETPIVEDEVIIDISGLYGSN